MAGSILPEGHPGELAESGVVRVDPQGLLDPRGRELRASGSVGRQGPAHAPVFTIGVIGFLLDRVMLALQTMFTHQATR